MRYAYHAALRQAALTRQAYRQIIPLLPAVQPKRSLGRAVVTFSSASDLPEQVASLRSLLRHVGQPSVITVVSDGSHSARDCAWLQALNSAIRVVPWSVYATSAVPSSARRYSEVHGLGKKLVALMALEDRPTLYADSDVLFFAGAEEAAELQGDGCFYLPDLPGGLDSRITSADAFAPANAGCFLTSGALRLRELASSNLPGVPTADDTYVEQTLVHLALHQAGAQPLPAATYVLRIDDHFRYRDACAPRRTALRHYIGMVRYKFWLAVMHTSTRQRA